jgi:hypothetical protein
MVEAFQPETVEVLQRPGDLALAVDCYRGVATELLG